MAHILSLGNTVDLSTVRIKSYVALPEVERSHLWCHNLFVFLATKLQNKLSPWPRALTRRKVKYSAFYRKAPQMRSDMDHTVFREHELMFSFYMYMLSPFRLSSVCLWRWCTLLSRLKFSAIFLRHLVPWPSLDIHWKFYGDRLRGTPPSGDLNARGVAKYSDFWHLECYNSETVQDRR